MKECCGEWQSSTVPPPVFVQDSVKCVFSALLKVADTDS